MPRSSMSHSLSQGPLLKPDQEDDYGLPAARLSAARSTSIASGGWNGFDRLGAHGLPLIGHGDWNDGMNRVGCKGKGESVWLAWFAIACLRRVRHDWPSRAAITAEPQVGGNGPMRFARPSRRTPGTATGTAARTSTMALRWARPKTTRARSTRSPRHGASCPAPPTRDVLARP